jgi:ribonuclease HI
MIKRHRTNLHVLFNLANISTMRMEKISATRGPPNFSPNITTRIDNSKELALEHDKSIEDVGVRVYSDGSGYQGQIGGAAVLYVNGQRSTSAQLHLGPDTEHTVYEGEIVGIILASHLLKECKEARRSSNDISISLDNQSSITALTNQETKPSHDLLDAAHKAIQSTTSKLQRSIPFVWVPGHMGSRGNEDADELAKQAALGTSTDGDKLPGILRKPIAVSVSATKQRLTKEIQAKWSRTWKNSARYEKAKRIEPKLPSKRYLKLTRILRRNQAAIIMQLRTGHVPLNEYLHRIKKASDPYCPHCPDTRENVRHYFAECRNYAMPRTELHRKLGRRAYDIPYLLSNPKAVRHTLDFIHSTERFSKTLGDLAPHEEF